MRGGGFFYLADEPGTGYLEGGEIWHEEECQVEGQGLQHCEGDCL